MKKTATFQADSFWNKRYRIYYSALFIGFGILITLLTAFVTYRVRIMDIQSELETNAVLELNKKQEELSSYISGLTDYVEAIKTSSSLLRYLNRPTAENRDDALNLLYVMAKTSPDFMQLRFLDEKGMEKLRVDKNFGDKLPTIIAQENLQDKSHRYYFKETALLNPNDYWYSHLDLNVENKQIEVPHKPVIRVASPAYIDHQFKGIVILNIHAKEFLNRFSDSSFFNISLIDRDGYYIVHHNQKLSWSRYLQTGHNIQDAFPDSSRIILAGTVPSKPKQFGEIFAASVASHLQKDGAVLIMEPKLDKIHSLENERRKAAVLIVLIIFFLSLPLSYLIARAPARLSQKILEQNKILTEYFKLIDTNILSCTTDTNGSFLDVSTAFTKRTGYDKQKLIGSDYSILYSQETETDVYHEMWNDIASGSTWHGEIPHLDRKGGTFWTETTIYPKQDDAGTITAYSFIHQDISDRKRIEKLSITDELTGLYNRRFFNKTLNDELNRVQRDKKSLSFAMVDVDFFKQYNDNYGHQKGDEVLKAVSQVFRQKLSRASDNCFRLGGEEFGIIFIDHKAEEARIFADDIRRAVENIGIEHRWSDVAETITISVGLLSVTPGPGISVDVIYRKADEALYLAKNSGRNRVEQAVIDFTV